MIKVEHKYFEEIELYIETFSPLHFFSKQVLDRLHYHMYIIISYNPSSTCFHLFFKTSTRSIT